MCARCYIWVNPASARTVTSFSFITRLSVESGTIPVSQSILAALKSPPNITVYFELFLSFSVISDNSVSKFKIGSVPLSGGL